MPNSTLPGNTYMGDGQRTTSEMQDALDQVATWLNAAQAELDALTGTTFGEAAVRGVGTSGSDLVQTSQLDTRLGTSGDLGSAATKNNGFILRPSRFEFTQFLGSQVVAIAAFGDYVYAVNTARSLNRYFIGNRESSNFLGTLSIGTTGLCFNGLGQAITSNTDNTIRVIQVDSFTVTDSFASPSTGLTGVAFDGTNLISCDSSTNLIYIHDGVSSTVTSSFDAPSGNISGVTTDGVNIYSCDSVEERVYLHDGYSASIIDDWLCGDAPNDIDHAGDVFFVSSNGNSYASAYPVYPISLAGA